MRRFGQRSVVARALIRHAAISVVVFALVGGAAAILCAQLVRREAVRQAESGGQAIAGRVVSPLITDSFYSGDPEAFRRLDDQVVRRTSGPRIQRVKVWSADGVILYCDDHRQIGLQFAFQSGDKALLSGVGVDSHFEDLDKSANLLDRGLGKTVDVHAGALDAQGRPILVETSFTADLVHARGAALVRRVLPVLLAALLLVLLVLVPMSLSVARTVARYEAERRAAARLAADSSSAQDRRVAAGLEDELIQNLAGVGYALTVLDRQMAGLPEVPARVASLRGILQTAQRRVHEDVLTLRAVAGQHAADSGAADPVDVLWGIVEDLYRSGTAVEIVAEELPALPTSHRAALIQVGHELLRNAAQHAPGANVVLSLHTYDREVVLAVMDDGPGFDPGSVPGPAEGHFGLTLIADAAERVGGRLELRSRPGHGTTVRMSLPIGDPGLQSGS